jgi:hypothetical protein
MGIFISTSKLGVWMVICAIMISMAACITKEKTEQEVFEEEYSALKITSKFSSNEMEANQCGEKAKAMISDKYLNQYELKVTRVENTWTDGWGAECESVYQIEFNRKEYRYHIRYFVKPTSKAGLENLAIGSKVLVTGQCKGYKLDIEDFVLVENATIESVKAD